MSVSVEILLLLPPIISLFCSTISYFVDRIVGYLCTSSFLPFPILPIRIRCFGMILERSFRFYDFLLFLF